ncbi:MULTISPECIES: DUF1501 domain-containing protein [unclassified Lentimonas]|uniref:DUF1501 domain-containing protein n=1 Tax=unclassified Lentimonas TaxID=2630993 RepID=UPI00132A4D8B|nr:MULTISPECIES: DUF1501 domain-containing protein [unclassified Lentimonas]CAA6692995.1 Unannotated [Lentimonas sp. CC10]CAA6695691.1 Unannotated [Lentimonas sp. CC19]CAA7069985.1 Unannotated [Lentimonas sp. CC11]
MKHSYETLTRREAIQRGLLYAAGAAGLSRLPLSAITTPNQIKPRAKAVIQIWLWGGPAHLDTFDPKPEAGADYCGPFADPIETNVSGMRINQLMPQLAQQADKYSLIRGMTHGVNAHETASYLTQTGHMPSRYVHPTMGAVVNYFKGERVGYDGVVPPYVVLTRPQGRFSESGFLGSQYQPFSTGGDPNKEVFAVEGIVAEGISDKRQAARRQLLGQMDLLGRNLGECVEFQQYDSAQAEAYQLILGESRGIFNLGQEDDVIRERYGRNNFGQSCLMARRLVENGVPYVTINYRGWDTHKGHFNLMNRMLPELDQGVANLLQDLSARGLLDSTIVWVGGEFGRTPKVQWEPPWSGGRGHFGNCFSTMIAGGGFAGGNVVGESDARGEEVSDRPVYPVDLLGSMYELMGIDPEAKLPNPHDVEMTVLAKESDQSVKRAGLLREIMPSVS